MKLSASDPDLETIVSRITANDLDLQPEFQRGEVWPLGKKRKLVDSVLREWHVPPIHVVVEKNGRQVVLDGQQRLVSIRDFVRGDFTIDGSIEPHDPLIESLNGLKYRDLPTDIRRKFDQFTIRMFRLTDYSPEEPGELFYRLNQMTHLTSAEQRNAFFGPVRGQVKQLVQQVSGQDWANIIGFSNRRMAYDDVFSRVLCTLEARTIARRVTASEISDRFRSRIPFSENDTFRLSGCLDTITWMFNHGSPNPRLNKATLYSWLLVLACFDPIIRRRKDEIDHLTSFWSFFERKRAGVASGTIVSDQTEDGFAWEQYHIALMDAYIDRSTSRVADISSVVQRDFITWFFYFEYNKSSALLVLPAVRRDILYDLRSKFRSRKDGSLRLLLEQSLDLAAWGDLDAALRGS